MNRLLCGGTVSNDFTFKGDEEYDSILQISRAMLQKCKMKGESHAYFISWYRFLCSGILPQFSCLLGNSQQLDIQELFLLVLFQFIRPQRKEIHSKIMTDFTASLKANLTAAALETSKYDHLF